MIAQRFGQPFPEILARGWIVEKISGAQDCVDAVTPPDVKNPRNDVHSRA
jgi:hypothetical protein